MSDFQKGYTFTDTRPGDFRADNIHALVENAELSNTALSSKTALDAIADPDTLLISDNSDSNALKKQTWANHKKAIQAAVNSDKANISQTGHGLSVGDIATLSGSNYIKATAVYPSMSFLAAAVVTGTNRITLDSTASLLDGERVKFSTTGTLPAPLTVNAAPYAKVISATVIELYHDAALANIIDITAQGTGTHTLHYQLQDSPRLGVVTAVPDSNNFSIVFEGEATGLTGLTAGLLYYLSPSTPGALTTTAPTGATQRVLPVLWATSATTAIMVGPQAQDFLPNDLAGTATISHQSRIWATGDIRPNSVNETPSVLINEGWLRCSAHPAPGSTVSKTIFANLYAVIGDAYEDVVNPSPAGEFRLPPLSGVPELGRLAWFIKT